MKVFIFLAEGFEEIEAVSPIDIFRRAQIEVETVSVTGELIVKGAHGVAIVADSLFEDVEFDAASFLFLPGGMPGTTNLDKHAGLKALILKHAEAHGEIAAICAAPLILGKLGLLVGQEAVCYPGFEDQLLKAKISEQNIVMNKSVFTAKAAGVAIEFALKIVENIKGIDVATKIANSIYFKRI